MVKHVVKEVLGVAALLIVYLNLAPFPLWGELTPQVALFFFAMLAIVGVGAPAEEGQPAYYLMGVGGLVPSLIGGIYLIRGQGPSTQEVEARLLEEQRQAQRKRRWANVASVVPSFTHRRSRAQLGVYETPADHQRRQVQAVANPQTAQALQNLENLQYTRVLTREEFQAAKDILLGEQPGPR